MRKPIGTMIDRFSPLTNLDAHALELTGFMGAFRYLGAHNFPQWEKGITPEELTYIVQNGLKVVFIWESDGIDRAYFTTTQGVQDAQYVMSELEYLNIAPSTNVVVYFSADFDAVSHADYQAVDDYLLAVEQTLGGKFGDGIYGDAGLLEYLFSGKARSKPRHGWQSAGWDDGKVWPHAAAWQYAVEQPVCGMTVDLNHVYFDPGWFPLDPKPTPVKPQKPVGATYHLTVTNTFPDAQKAAEAALEVSKLGFDVKVSQN